MPFHFIKGQCHGCSNPTTESQIEIFNMKISQNDPFWIMSFVITNRCEICMRLNVNNRRQNNSPIETYFLERIFIALAFLYCYFCCIWQNNVYPHSGAHNKRDSICMQMFVCVYTVWCSIFQFICKYHESISRHYLNNCFGLSQFLPNMYFAHSSIAFWEWNF